MCFGGTLRHSCVSTRYTTQLIPAAFANFPGPASSRVAVKAVSEAVSAESTPALVLQRLHFHHGEQRHSLVRKQDQTSATAGTDRHCLRCVRREGWLEKQGKMRLEGYSRRYFVLTEQTFEYWAPPKVIPVDASCTSPRLWMTDTA